MGTVLVVGAVAAAAGLGVAVRRGGAAGVAADRPVPLPEAEVRAGGAQAPLVVPAPVVGTPQAPVPTGGVKVPTLGQLGAVAVTDFGNTPSVAPPVPLPPFPGIVLGTAPSPKPSEGGSVLGTVAAEVGKKGLEALVGGSAATISAGFQVADATRGLMTKVGGEGVGNISSLNPTVAAGLAVKAGAEKVGNALGLPAELTTRVAQVVGVAAVDPTGIATGLKVTAEVASLGIRAVAGVGAEKAVRGAVAQLDPTNSKTVPGKAVAVVATGVSKVSDFFKGKLF